MASFRGRGSAAQGRGRLALSVECVMRIRNVESENAGVGKKKAGNVDQGLFANWIGSKAWGCGILHAGLLSSFKFLPSPEICKSHVSSRFFQLLKDKRRLLKSSGEASSLPRGRTEGWQMW